jgi:hypothetical protein
VTTSLPPSTQTSPSKPPTRLVHRGEMRLAGALAAGGSVLSVVVNGLHPHADLDTEHFMAEVAAASAWIPLHLGICIAAVLNLGGNLMMGRVLTTGRRRPVIVAADGAAVVACAVMIVLMGLDGFTTKHFADYYMAAQGAERAAIEPTAYLILLLLLAGLGQWYALYLGVAMPLYSHEMLRQRAVPQWIAHLGIWTGLCALVTGCLIYTLGASFLVTTVLFLIFSSLGFIWQILVGVTFWRRASRDSDAEVTA